MNQIFRLRKYYRNVGIVSLIFVVGMMIVSMFAGVLDVPPDRKILAACVFYGVWGFMSFISIWILLAYYRESLHITEDSVIQHGVIWAKTMNFSELTEVRWRCVPLGGSVVVCSTSKKIKIYLSNFEPEQRQFLIRFFHLTTPEDIQCDWKLFCHKIAMPSRKQSLDLPLKPDEVLLTRRRWDWLFLICFLVLMMLCAGIGWLLQRFCIFFMPFSLFPLWLWLRFSTPPQGMRSKKLSSDGENFLPIPIWGAVGMGGIFLFKAFQNQIPWFGFWATVGLVVWFGVLLVIAYNIDRRKRREDLAKTDDAAKEWERLESVVTADTPAPSEVAAKMKFR